MSDIHEFSDFEAATPYEFLSGFIEHQGEMDHDTFYVDLHEDDNIEVLEGSDLATLVKILYDAGYAASAEYPLYFLQVHLYHVDGANSEWRIIPMSFHEGLYDCLITYLSDPEFDSNVLDPEIAEDLASEGTLAYLLDKDWTNGEIQDLLTWIAREGKLISPDNYSQWIELSPPRYKKSGRK